MDVPNAGTVLKAQELVKKFAQILAVDKVSLDVSKGECFALLGPNGAGKTTTCEMLEGLTPPDSGNIEICGLKFPEQRGNILKRIGVALQETNLYKKYTVKETLELFSSFYPQSISIPKLLAKLKLEDKADARLEHLSGGQKQRVYLGCALVHNPELLFLDEPTSGLDPQARRYLWDLLKEVKADGRSIFLTTHYMEEAQELADRIAIMDHGQIIAMGSLHELVSHHCEGDFLVFKTSTSELEALQKNLPWLQTASKQGAENFYEVNVDNATTKTREFMREVDTLGVYLGHFSIRQSTLEDVFLKLTGRNIRDD
ncbi:MAG: ABC transporter ATP-binding protein [Oligoflexales bacterium]